MEVMRRILCLPVLAGSLLWAQPPADPISAAPETVIGTVDGVKVTAAELRYAVLTSDPQLQQALKKNPVELLRYYGFMKRLAEMAETAKLDRESPQVERLRISRMQIMAEAQMDAFKLDADITPEEQKKFYESNRQRYATARVRVIYVSYMLNPPKTTAPGAKKIASEPEARAKAEAILKELRAGADFAKLVKQYSEHTESAAKDGDFGTIRGSDNYPEDVKKAVLAGKAGDLIGPIRLGNGYYIFRVDESILQPYDSVKDEIFTELKDKRFYSWIEKVRSAVDVKLEQGKNVDSGGALRP